MLKYVIDVKVLDIKDGRVTLELDSEDCSVNYNPIPLAVDDTLRLHLTIDIPQERKK